MECVARGGFPFAQSLNHSESLSASGRALKHSLNILGRANDHSRSEGTVFRLSEEAKKSYHTGENVGQRWESNSRVQVNSPEIELPLIVESSAKNPQRRSCH